MFLKFLHFWRIFTELIEKFQAHELSPDNTVIGFGVHPWFTYTLAANGDDDPSKDEDEKQQLWYTTLRNHLINYPQAFVGEIGLDKIAKSQGGSFSLSAIPVLTFFIGKGGKGTKEELWIGQSRLFRIQMKLARELGRPASVHCVGAQGQMFDLFREWSKQDVLPRRICLHSYGNTHLVFTFLFTKDQPPGGSVDMVKCFTSKAIKATVYFGFSYFVNLRSPKTKDVIKAIPPDRILLESDLAGVDGLVEGLETMYNVVAEIRGWTLQETAELVYANSCAFYGVDPASNK